MAPLQLKPPKSSNSFIYLVIVVLLASALFIIFNPGNSNIKNIKLNQFIEQVKSGEVAKIQVRDDRINITRIDDTQAYTYKESSISLPELLKDVPENIKKDIDIEIVPKENNDFWLSILASTIPFLIVAGVFVFFARQAQNSNNQALSFGKSRARLYDSDKKKTLFADVAGAEEAKEELIEIVDFLKNPSKYSQMGAKIPKGVLLVGSPGTGKTLLARAVAGEANVPFFTISGSEFVEMFVGVGASRVRDLFRKAKKNAPCIIFIDEIDAVGRQRGTGLGGGHDEREQTLNQILTEMDGFEGDTGVIVMAATNRPDVLDPALLRPGRFDRRVVVDLPDIKDREAILKVHARNKPLDENVDLNKIAQHTPGFSGADLENLMNEAAIFAAKSNRRTINMNDIQQSVEKVMMGPEKKSRGLSEKEKEITAYHEVGHAVVGHLSKNCDPVHKVSIVSRGMALGVTWFLPEDDKHLYSRSKFFDEICSLLGGYTAELVFFGEMTTGASNDLEKATNIATRMVTQYGMSSLGPMIFGEKSHDVFLGRDLGRVNNHSEETSKRIDLEVKSIIEKAFEITKKLIVNHKHLIEKISKELIEKESLTRQEFVAFFDKKDIDEKTEKSEKKHEEKKNPKGKKKES